MNSITKSQRTSWSKQQELDLINYIRIYKKDELIRHVHKYIKSKD